MLARITGVVLGTERVRGTARTTGNEYDFLVTNVFVAGQDVAKVQIQTQNSLGYEGGPLSAPRPGELVDWLVSVGVYRNEPALSLRDAAYPDDATSLAVLAAAV